MNRKNTRTHNPTLGRHTDNGLLRRWTESQLLTAVTRNCWFFLASASFSRISSILADTTQFAGFTTSRGRETLTVSVNETVNQHKLLRQKSNYF